MDIGLGEHKVTHQSCPFRQILSTETWAGVRWTHLPLLPCHHIERQVHEEVGCTMPFCSFERWGEQLPWTVRPLSLKHTVGKRKVTFLTVLEFKQGIFCSSFWPFAQLESIVSVMFLICNGSFLLFDCSFLLNILLTRRHFQNPSL